MSAGRAMSSCAQCWSIRRRRLGSSRSRWISASMAVAGTSASWTLLWPVSTWRSPSRTTSARFSHSTTTTCVHSPRICSNAPPAYALRDKSSDPANLRSGEALVFDAVRLLGVDAQPALLVGLVLLVIAFEPLHMAVAFESEHVG